MKLSTIKKLQKKYGYFDLQEMITSGICWKMEGSIGRSAMESLKSGICMLPEQSFRDYYGNRVPSRNDLKEGTMGTKQNCVSFWTKVDEGSIFLSDNC